MFWEGMEQDIANAVRPCRECFLKNPRQSLCLGLKPRLASKPFELVSVDNLELGVRASGMKHMVV